MKWSELKHSKILIHSLCKRLKQIHPETNYHLNRIATALENSWMELENPRGKDKIATLILSFAAVIIALCSMIQAYIFYSMEREDRRGNIVCNVRLGKDDSTFDNALENDRIIAASVKRGGLQYNCTITQDFEDNAVFIYWESDKEASVDLDLARSRLNEYRYSVKIFKESGKRDIVYTTEKQDEKYVRKYDRYAYIKINNNATKQRILKAVGRYPKKDKFCLKIEKQMYDSKESSDNGRAAEFNSYPFFTVRGM